MNIENNRSFDVTESLVAKGKSPLPMAIGPANSSFLDICRGAAASIVLLGHAQDIFHIGPGFRVPGVLGVSIFFLLSGFLIAISIFNHLMKDNPQLSVFLSDRVARIATPFLPVLCLVAAINWLLDPGNWGQFGVNRGAYAFIGNALLLNDYPVLQGLSNKWNITSYYVRSYNTAEPFWTIPIEFWIYVGVGVFAFVILGREKIRLGFGLAALLIATPVIVWNSFAGGGKCLTLIWFVGAGFGGLWICLRRQLGRKLWPVGIVLLFYGLASLTGKVLKAPFDPLEVQTAILMASILFGVAFLLEGLEDRKALRQFGVILSSYSYSLYLVHNTVLVLAFEYSPRPDSTAYLVAIFSAHIVAVIIYLLFERHYRRVSMTIRPLLAMLCSPQNTASTGNVSMQASNKA